MIYCNNPIIKHKAGLLNLAEELSNVSKACKVMDMSRDTFYRYQELVDQAGLDALIDKSRRSPNIKNRVDEASEQTKLLWIMQLISLHTVNIAPVMNYVNKVYLFQEAVFALFGCVTIWRISRNA